MSNPLIHLQLNCNKWEGRAQEGTEREGEAERKTEPETETERQRECALEKKRETNPNKVSEVKCCWCCQLDHRLV